MNGTRNSRMMARTAEQGLEDPLLGIELGGDLGVGRLLGRLEADDAVIDDVGVEKISRQEQEEKPRDIKNRGAEIDGQFFPDHRQPTAVPVS